MSTASQLQVWGIDHHRAPVELRETVHIDDAAGARLHDVLRSTPGFVCCIPVSTCNRTEIYLEVETHCPVMDMMLGGLGEIGLDGEPFLGESGFRLRGWHAVDHLYRVASGLESMMLGEPQIVGQLKGAYSAAKGHHELGPVMMRAFQGAFRASKRVRSETKIDRGAVSVAFAAVELSRKFFADLSRARGLLIGAGETGALAAKHFLQQGIGGLAVINRSPEKADALAEELNAGRAGPVRASRWEALAEVLGEVDVVLTVTGSPTAVILPDLVRPVLSGRKGKPLFILDIAVPRDVDPVVGKLPGAYVFGLDDLDEIVQTNLASRRKLIPQAETVITEELAQFRGWIRDMGLYPTVGEFRAYLEELKEKQMGFVRKQQPEEIAAAVEANLKQFIKKMLGRSMANLKNAPSQEERQRDLDSLRRLFGGDERR